MGTDRVKPLARAERAAGAGTSAVELRYGAGPALWADQRGSGARFAAGAERRDRPATPAGVVSRGGAQARPRAAHGRGRGVLCAIAGLGAQLVGARRASARAGLGCDHARRAFQRAGAVRGLSRLRGPRGLDGGARESTGGVASPLGAAAAPPPGERASELGRGRARRPWSVRALALRGDRAPGLASGLARQRWGRQWALSPAQWWTLAPARRAAVRPRQRLVRPGAARSSVSAIRRCAARCWPAGRRATARAGWC